jgi:hypothetical protein
MTGGAGVDAAPVVQMPEQVVPGGSIQRAVPLAGVVGDLVSVLGVMRPESAGAK